MPTLANAWARSSKSDSRSSSSFFTPCVWYLVINGLLPLVEGVLLYVTFPSGTRPKAIDKGVDRLAQSAEDEAAFRALEMMIFTAGSGSALFNQYSPPAGLEPRSLNRNAVLHGSARRYGTQQNATKLRISKSLDQFGFSLEFQKSPAITPAFQLASSKSLQRAGDASHPAAHGWPPDAASRLVPAPTRIPRVAGARRPSRCRRRCSRGIRLLREDCVKGLHAKVFGLAFALAPRLNGEGRPHGRPSRSRSALRRGPFGSQPSGRPG
jgi:hypothetical protein